MKIHPCSYDGETTEIVTVAGLESPLIGTIGGPAHVPSFAT